MMRDAGAGGGYVHEYLLERMSEERVVSSTRTLRVFTVPLFFLQCNVMSVSECDIEMAFNLSVHLTGTNQMKSKLKFGIRNPKSLCYINSIAKIEKR